MSENHPTNFVIAISSVSGGGKTSLVIKTAELLNATMVFFDDYADSSQYPKDNKKWLEDGADVNEWKTPQFARDVAALRKGESITAPRDGRIIQPSEYIVIEEPMGRERAEMAPHIDFVAVIDIPLEIALARRLIRDMDFFDIKDIDAASRDQLTTGFKKLINYVRGYLGSYLRTGRTLYDVIQEQAKASCDLLLDGERPADDLAKELVAAVKNARGNQ